MLSVNPTSLNQFKARSFTGDPLPIPSGAKTLVGEPLPKPTGACSFKAKPSAKELKQVGKVLEEIKFNTILKDPKISKDVELELLNKKILSDLSQMTWLEKLKLLFKKTV